MPRITHAQYQELEQQLNQAVADRAKIAEKHVEDIKKIEAQVVEVAKEHDAVVQQYKDRIAELETAAETERRSREALEEELAQEKGANESLVAEIHELKRRASASLNYITAAFIGLFGTAIASLAVSRCQEPEL